MKRQSYFSETEYKLNDQITLVNDWERGEIHVILSDPDGHNPVDKVISGEELTKLYGMIEELILEHEAWVKDARTRDYAEEWDGEEGVHWE